MAKIKIGSSPKVGATKGPNMASTGRQMGLPASHASMVNVGKSDHVPGGAVSAGTKPPMGSGVGAGAGSNGFSC